MINDAYISDVVLGPDFDMKTVSTILECWFFLPKVKSSYFEVKSRPKVRVTELLLHEDFGMLLSGSDKSMNIWFVAG